MDAILDRLNRLEELIKEQSLSQKEVLNFTEATIYLELSASHLYKLTSSGTIPFYKPNGKKIYFKRSELNEWLLSNRQQTTTEIESIAENFKIKKGGGQS
ncbi:helix-turn-helix transcriptional regulator [Jiulongibacter sp. NS-SX5]|uniref:helix-turn-helix transcriptional regulator n=1 Tax=Jiulongibacter sp. NS-SX5 TaxID=3463854 RepID=UPI0040594522